MMLFTGNAGMRERHCASRHSPSYVWGGVVSLIVENADE